MACGDPEVSRGGLASQPAPPADIAKAALALPSPLDRKALPDPNKSGPFPKASGRVNLGKGQSAPARYSHGKFEVPGISRAEALKDPAKALDKLSKESSVPDAKEVDRFVDTKGNPTFGPKHVHVIHKPDRVDLIATDRTRSGNPHLGGISLPAEASGADVDAAIGAMAAILDGRTR